MNKIDFNIIWKVVVVVFAAGMFYMQVLAIRQDLERMDAKFDRLEQKVEKHNNFDRRIIKLETMLEIKKGNFAYDKLAEN